MAPGRRMDLSFNTRRETSGDVTAKTGNSVDRLMTIREFGEMDARPSLRQWTESVTNHKAVAQPRAVRHLYEIHLRLFAWPVNSEVRFDSRMESTFLTAGLAVVMDGTAVCNVG